MLPALTQPFTMDTIKGTTRRVNLSDSDLQMLKEISDSTNLSQVELLTQMVHAAIGCVHENGKRLTFPLRFEPVEDFLLREKSSQYGSKPPRVK